MTAQHYTDAYEPRTQCTLPNQHVSPVTTKYVRCTHTLVPNTQQLLDRVGLPVGVVIHPMAELDDDESLPLVNFAECTGSSKIGIVRCIKCNTYINPYCQFTDQGKRWHCNVCRALNSTPPEYYCPLDQYGVRKDIANRPELTHCMVELVAASNMMVRPPQKPSYCFALDVSYQSVQCGFLAAACRAVKECVQKIRGDSPQVCIITYSSTVTLHTLQAGKQERAYSLPELSSGDVTGKPSEAGGLEDVWLPCLIDNLLVARDDSKDQIVELLEKIPARHENTQDVESAMGSAVAAAMRILTGTGGKLSIFAAGRPTVGIGKLRSREDEEKKVPKDKENTLFKPADLWYNDIAMFAVKEQTTIDLYLHYAGHCDLASISALPKNTGGDLRTYGDAGPQPRGRQSEYAHAELLSADVRRILLRETAFEAVMRVRCTVGWKLNHLYGHYHLRNDLLTLPNCDPDKAYGIELIPGDGTMGAQLCVQSALLYTTAGRERRVRIHTAVYEVSSNASAIYAGLDVHALSCILYRKAVSKLFEEKLESARAYLVERVSSAVRGFRQLAGVRTSQLLLPTAIRRLPLFSLGMLKGPCLRGDAKPDARSRAMARLATLPADRLAAFVVPVLWVIRRDGAEVAPCTRKSLRDCSLAVVDDCQRVLLWVSRRADPAAIRAIFGEEDPPPGKQPARLPDDPTNSVFWEVVDNARDPLAASVAGGTPPIVVARQDTAEEDFVLRALIEDEVSKVMAYGAMLEHLHKSVTQPQS